MRQGIVQYRHRRLIGRCEGRSESKSDEHADLLLSTRGFLLNGEFGCAIPASQLIRKEGVVEPHFLIVADLHYSHPAEHSIVNRAHQCTELFFAALLEKSVKPIHRILLKRLSLGDTGEFVHASAKRGPPSVQ